MAGKEKPIPGILENKSIEIFPTCCSLLVAGIAHAQRVVLPMNNGWQFTKDTYVPASRETASVNWQPVSLPHTWNIQDVMDDIPGYYKGVGWYKKQLIVPAGLKNKNLFLFFEGVNQQTIVFVNGKKAGIHSGWL
jgi:beta-galactosidase